MQNFFCMEDDLRRVQETSMLSISNASHTPYLGTHALYVHVPPMEGEEFSKTGPTNHFSFL